MAVREALLQAIWQQPEAAAETGRTAEVMQETATVEMKVHLQTETGLVQEEPYPTAAEE